MILSAVGLFVKLVLWPVFSVLGLVHDLLFWPLAWLACGLLLLAIAFVKGEPITMKQVKIALAFGPFIWLLWGLALLVNYFGVSISGILGNAITQLNKIFNLKDVVKDSVTSTVKDTANSCKKTATSATTKAQETAKSVRDQVVAYKNQAVNFVKSKFQKTEKLEEKEEDKEDEKE